MSSFLRLVMGVFRIGLITDFKCFFQKQCLVLGMGWIQFYKRTLRETNRMFGYGGLFVKLMGMQLFINKL